MENHYKNIKSLIENTKDKIGKPVSSQVVAATIESFGIREKDTMQDFGFLSIQDLADLVYYELTTDQYHIGAKNAKEREVEQTQPKTIQVSDYLRVKAKIFAEYYSLGIFHLLPVLIQIAAIIVFGYSLWTYVGFNQIQSTAVVLGVIVGLIATGGFVQVIGRQASFYWNYEDYQMTRQTINYLHKVGVLSIFLVLGVIFLANFFFHLYPYEVLFVVFAYAFLIGLLLLLLAPLHTIKQRWVITVAVLAGTAVAIFLKESTQLMVYTTHWIGIAVAIVISKAFLVLYFNRLIKKNQSQTNHKIKVPVMLYHNYQFFFYGIFIYVFIFIDRILAWSSGANGPLPFLVYFEKNYELGMDLAILVFLLLAGVLEYSIASFTRFIDIGQKNTSHNTPEVFNKSLRNMYWQQILLLFVTSALAFGFIYLIISASWGFEAQFKEPLLRLSIKVCLLGGAGYMLLAWGMLNSLYLFTLGQAMKPLKAIIYACLVNLFLGFVLSRFFAYEYSVVGMLCGAALFVALTLRANINYFKNLDYYYYAAY
ncbi:hypothetical protein [Flavobacterium caeni]|uniref:Exopolysaccharide Exporter (EPS-E) n=1 Tax=Flavobacterium caeni TaxID=490189 RepID=A0A1G5D508_9FLAO|nr:hypothetical protein [Flavobacterium caeni]SCY09601.1 hypothetical protein SAMN02927903_00745 [Flavobacterium caeni]